LSAISFLVLLAAQLPQREGLLLAWLMDLLVQVSMNSALNGTTVMFLGEQVSDVCCSTLRRMLTVACCCFFFARSAVAGVLQWKRNCIDKTL
jgi:hypothetical protein